MRIEIQWAVLESLHAELSELQAMHGAILAARFACETPAEIKQTICGPRTWLEEMKALWVMHKHPGKSQRQAA